MWGEAPLDVSVVTTWLSPARGLVSAPREDSLVANRALGFGRSIHGGQGATRILVYGCADLAASVLLGQITNHAAAKYNIMVQQAFLRVMPGRAGGPADLLGPIDPVRARVASDPQGQASDDTPWPSSKQHHRYTKLLTPYDTAHRLALGAFLREKEQRVGRVYDNGSKYTLWCSVLSNFHAEAWWKVHMY